MRKIGVKRLKEVVSYDPDTGVFTWLKRPDKAGCGGKVWNLRYAGKPAGSVASNGYLRLSIDNKQYWAHRMAWLYVTGSFPSEMIDHINCTRTDNRFANLRQATAHQNSFNRQPKPLRGVSKVKCGYRAAITHNYQTRHIGVFPTADAAAAAYRAEAAKLRGRFCGS